MSERKGFKPMLASLMAKAGFPLNDPLALPDSSGRVPKRIRKKHDEPRYKPCFSMGYRGYPKSLTPRGLVPAPTIDQVRFLEREYGHRLMVRYGTIRFRDGSLFSPEAAAKRPCHV